MTRAKLLRLGWGAGVLEAARKARTDAEQDAWACLSLRERASIYDEQRVRAQAHAQLDTRVDAALPDQAEPLVI
jgi:hypothetical protein